MVLTDQIYKRGVMRKEIHDRNGARYRLGCLYVKFNLQVAYA